MILSPVSEGNHKFKIIIEYNDGIKMDVEGDLSFIDLYDILSNVTNTIVGRLYEKCKDQ